MYVKAKIRGGCLLVLEKTRGFMDFSSMIGMNRVGPTTMFASFKDYSVFHRTEFSTNNRTEKLIIKI